jgi:hypothetical protein
MQSVNTFKILPQSSVEPFLSMDYELMQQIQHIVAIAPKEAQWFHLLEDMDNSEFRLKEMFIPEQVCSSVEVDTDSQMMISFWNELKDKFGVVEASNKLTKMTVWCHSHHNMAPNPSGQDNKQFYELVKQQRDAGTNRPVVMLIFNKKDDYYCRLWDPKTNLVYEGLDIVYTEYDMSWIDAEAKKKFKEPVVKTILPPNTKVVGSSNHFWANPSYPKPPLTTSYSARSLDYDIHDYNPDNYKSKTPATIAETKMRNWFGSTYSDLTIITKPLAETFADAVFEDLETEEKYILGCLLKKQRNFYDKISSTKDKKFAKKSFVDSIVKALTVNKVDYSFLEQLLTNTFEMYDHYILQDTSNFEVWTNDFIDFFESYSTEPQYSIFSETINYKPFNK